MPEDIAVALNNLAYSLSEHDIVSDNDARIMTSAVAEIYLLRFRLIRPDDRLGTENTALKTALDQLALRLTANTNRLKSEIIEAKMEAQCLRVQLEEFRTPKEPA